MFAVVVCLSACAAEPVTVDAARVDCGPPPARPGIVAAFDGQGNATMSVQTYNAITAYVDAASAWMTCKESPP